MARVVMTDYRDCESVQDCLVYPECPHAANDEISKCLKSHEVFCNYRGRGDILGDYCSSMQEQGDCPFDGEEHERN